MPTLSPTRRLSSSLLVVAGVGIALATWSGSVLAAETVWTFDGPADRLAAASGPGTLVFHDPFGGEWGEVLTDFGAASAFGLPAMEGGDPQVMAFPACLPEQGYLLTHAGAANGPYAESLGLISNYTLIFDVYWPSTSDGQWRALWQTDVFNGTDGEFFVQNQASGGIGINGNYRGALAPDRWHRVAIVVRAAPGEGQAHRFVDGRFVGAIGTTGSGLEERFALGPEALLLTDDNSETQPGFLASFLFVDRAMTMAEIAALGGPHAAGAATPGPPPPPEPAVMPRFVEAIGHRGGSFCCAPDNTLPAVRQAFLDGAAGVEVDTRITADGVVVCFHDATVDRTTDGTGPVDSFTLAELQALDAGSWFDPSFAGERVPSLTEVLEEAKGKGIVYLDMKVGGQAPGIKAALDASGFPVEDLWIWTPGNPAEAAAIRAEIPDALVVWGAPDGSWITDPNYFDDLRALGVAGFSFGFGGGGASREFCARANAEGLFVEVFTLLDQQTMIAAAAAGVNYIETDFPATLVGIQPPRGATASAPTPEPGTETGASTLVLGWVPAAGATAHRIHFGTTDPPPMVAEQVFDLFPVTDLEPGTTYHWRIDAVTAEGTVPGETWTFTTAAPAPPENIDEFGLDGDLANALGTAQLAFAGFDSEDLSSFETTDGIDVPHIDGRPAGYLRIPAFFSSADGLDLSLPDTAPNGNGEFINRFTFVFDVLLPFDLDWMPFFNTLPANTNDADFFVRSDGAIGIGALGYSPDGVIQPGTWHRVVFSADLDSGDVTYYVDGLPVHRRSGGTLRDQRFSLFPNTIAPPHVRLFGDENGETHEVLVAAIAFIDEPLGDAAVAALGPPRAGGIFATPAPDRPTLDIRRIGSQIALGWDEAPTRLLQRTTDPESGPWTDLEETLGSDGWAEPLDPGASVFFRLLDR